MWYQLLHCVPGETQGSVKTSLTALKSRRCLACFREEKKNDRLQLDSERIQAATSTRKIITNNAKHQQDYIQVSTTARLNAK